MVLWNLRKKELEIIQNVLLDMYGLPDSVIDSNFASLSPEVRRRKGRRRQRCNRSNPHGPKRCSECGSTENLQRHHRIPSLLGGRNTKDNLVWLCEDCHDRLHGRPA